MTNEMGYKKSQYLLVSMDFVLLLHEITEMAATQK